jgi:hypothetical protein
MDAAQWLGALSWDVVLTAVVGGVGRSGHSRDDRAASRGMFARLPGRDRARRPLTRFVDSTLRLCSPLL